jgi:hypothetical protein
MTLKTRLERLEGRQHSAGTRIDIIWITSVAPGPEGPIDLGLLSAHLLSGPNAGLEMHRDDTESTDGFEARCKAMLAGQG